MEVLKLVTVVLIVIVGYEARKYSEKQIIKNLMDRYEDYLDDMENEEDLQDPLVVDTTDLKNKDKDGNGNYDTCDAADVKCSDCSRCFPGGWCVKRRDGSTGCFCKQGWTGTELKTSVYVTDDSDKWGLEGQNRIVAENCDRACHYGYFRRNPECAGPCVGAQCSKPPDTVKDCNPKCVTSNGKCDTSSGKCFCCRGWSGPNAYYDKDKDHYVADFCDKECPYLGKGIPNVNCKHKPCKKCPPDEECDPLTGECVPKPKPCHNKCGQNFGKCIKATGKCECCYGWTGPNPAWGPDDKIHADYCDVYCQYKKGYQVEDCVNPTFIEKLRQNPNRVFTP